MKGTAAARVEGSDLAAGALDACGGKDRHRHAIQRRQVRHVVVERLERALPRVAQDLFEASFGLTGKKRDAKIHGLLQFGGNLRQHREAAGDVKAADADLHPCRS